MLQYARDPVLPPVRTHRCLVVWMLPSMRTFRPFLDRALRY